MLDKAEKLKVSKRCGPSSKCMWPVGCELPALKVKVKCAWKPSTDSPKHCHEIPLGSNLETFPTGQCHESTFLLGPVLRCSALIQTQGLHWPRNVTRPEGSTCLLIPPSYKKVIVPGLPASWGPVRKEPEIPLFWLVSKNVGRTSLERKRTIVQGDPYTRAQGPAAKLGGVVKCLGCR